MFDAIIIGSGFAGAVSARQLAEKGKKVLILEQRNHIGGNCYDRKDSHGILIHQYGPHIFHTYEKRVYDYLSQYTEWYPYSHKVAGKIYDQIIPIPFNLNSLELVYGKEKGKELEEKLVQAYGRNSRVPILKMMKHEEKEIREIAEYVYQNIFLKYTMKQWGQTPKEIDPSITARVPVLISRDDRYFQDTYQGMPKDGYTSLFETLLRHENITISLDTKAEQVLTIKEEEGKGKIQYRGEDFYGWVIYTGPVDELFECRFGRLPYRSLRFQEEYYPQEYYQQVGVVNYTVTEEYTRITEFKYLTGQRIPFGTTIMKEYPVQYKGKSEQIPYYAIINEENLQLYQRYQKLAEQIANLHLLGRLAEYRYYNMDAIILRALKLTDELVK